MPPTATPAESRIVGNFRFGLIELLSGGERYVVKAEQGNFSLTIPGPSVAVYTDRGKLYDPSDPEDAPQVQYDQDAPMTFTFTAHLRDIGGSQDYLSLTDFVTHSGLFLSRWGSEHPDAGEDSPRLVTVQWWLKGSRFGAASNKGFRLPFSHISGSVAEGSPNAITVNGTSYCVYPQQARWER